MTLEFFKYHGAGNDFVVVDNRQQVFDPGNNALVQRLCDRRFGIGGDGLMLIQDHPDLDFEMIYYNSDGYEGSLCGNGGRCIVAFAHFLGLFKQHTRFMAVDGVHDATLLGNELVRLKMGDITDFELDGQNYYLNTGSPHYVIFDNNLKDRDVYNEGRAIRYNERFKKEGTNVNFVEEDGTGIFVRTYERGVENETYACGTGIVASAISVALAGKTDKNEVHVRALGGKLKVSFERNGNNFSNIWLEGPAKQVFKGYMDTKI